RLSQRIHAPPQAVQSSRVSVRVFDREDAPRMQKRGGRISELVFEDLRKGQVDRLTLERAHASELECSQEGRRRFSMGFLSSGQIGSELERLPEQRRCV